MHHFSQNIPTLQFWNDRLFIGDLECSIHWEGFQSASSVERDSGILCRLTVISECSDD